MVVETVFPGGSDPKATASTRLVKRWWRSSLNWEDANVTVLLMLAKRAESRSLYSMPMF
ncbi:unnamed protein product [Brassica oleracea]